MSDSRQALGKEGLETSAGGAGASRPRKDLPAVRARSVLVERPSISEAPGGRGAAFSGAAGRGGGGEKIAREQRANSTSAFSPSQKARKQLGSAPLMSASSCRLAAGGAAIASAAGAGSIGMQVSPSSSPAVTTATMLASEVFTGAPIQSSLSARDFRFVRVVGKGTYGEVWKAILRETSEQFAVKVLDKGDIMQAGSVDRVMAEKSILQEMQHPFIVKLHYAFQSQTKLYFVLDYVPGGDLFHALNQVPGRRVSENSMRTIIAEVLLAVEHLHHHHIIFRDLKLENVLMSPEGHAILTDFGMAKELSMERSKMESVVGTPAYMAPEIILEEPYGREVDYWALGVMAYELVVGQSPFEGSDLMQTCLGILQKDIVFPDATSEPCRSFISGLLERNPARRLGKKRGCAEIKAHAFFADLDWAEVLSMRATPGIQPPKKVGLSSTVDDSLDAPNPIIDEAEELFRQFTPYMASSRPSSAMSALGAGGTWTPPDAKRQLACSTGGIKHTSPSLQARRIRVPPPGGGGGSGGAKGNAFKQRSAAKFEIPHRPSKTPSPSTAATRAALETKSRLDKFSEEVDPPAREALLDAARPARIRVETGDDHDGKQLRPTRSSYNLTSADKVTVNDTSVTAPATPKAWESKKGKAFSWSPPASPEVATKSLTESLSPKVKKVDTPRASVATRRSSLVVPKERMSPIFARAMGSTPGFASSPLSSPPSLGAAEPESSSGEAGNQSAAAGAAVALSMAPAGEEGQASPSPVEIGWLGAVQRFSECFREWSSLSKDEGATETTIKSLFTADSTIDDLQIRNCAGLCAGSRDTGTLSGLEGAKKYLDIVTSFGPETDLDIVSAGADWLAPPRAAAAVEQLSPGGSRMPVAEGRGRLAFSMRACHSRATFGVPATGRPVTIRGEVHCSFDESFRIVDMIVTWDGINFMSQLLK